MAEWLTQTGEALLSVETPDKGIVVLTLNRPKQRNALSVDLMSALSSGLKAAANAPDIAAVIIAANGPAFCSGHDLKEMTAHRTDADGGRAFFETTMSTCSALMQEIVRHPKPVIAAVEGTATAAGCQLVASCDLAVAARNAHFATPGVNIGLFCSTPMVALSRNVPRKKAMEMLLLGDAMSAEDAAMYGLVNRTVLSEDVRATALAMARTIASRSKVTVKIGKAAFYDQIEMPLADAYAAMSRTMVENMLEADAVEGISAFIEKRPPTWCA